MKLLICLLCSVVCGSTASGEPLEKRFGADRERGYRSDREFGGSGRDFKNRDRANFLGVKKQVPEPEMPHTDLHSLPRFGTQR